MGMLGPPRFTDGILIIASIFLLPGLRAQMATDAYLDLNLSFWQAHKISGEVFQDLLSMLPFVGFVFRRRDEGHDDDPSES